MECQSGWKQRLIGILNFRLIEYLSKHLKRRCTHNKRNGYSNGYSETVVVRDSHLKRLPILRKAVSLDESYKGVSGIYLAYRHSLKSGQDASCRNSGLSRGRLTMLAETYPDPDAVKAPHSFCNVQLNSSRGANWRLEVREFVVFAAIGCLSPWNLDNVVGCIGTTDR